MTFTKEHIVLTIIGIISLAALILGIVSVASNGNGCRGDRMGMMGNQRMMQQDFQGRGKMMMQKPCFNTKGNMPAQPTAKTPTK